MMEPHTLIYWLLIGLVVALAIILFANKIILNMIDVMVVSG